jgi:hypothetical protein
MWRRSWFLWCLPLVSCRSTRSLGAERPKTLFTALQQAERSAGNPDILLGAVESGVSANLLEALVDIEPEGQRSAIEINVNWLRGSPGPDFARLIRLPQGAFRHFKSVAKALREATPLQNADLEGYIIAVNREQTDTVGRVTLATTIEALGETKVRIDLDPAQYQIALKAHGDGQRVRVVGTLKKVGRLHVLEQHSGVEVLADER